MPVYMHPQPATLPLNPDGHQLPPPLLLALALQVPTCAPEAILKNMRLLLAIEKLVEECGFEDIVPATWVDKVNAHVPGIGFHIR